LKTKRYGVAAIALAAAGALVLTGCTSGGSEPSAPAGDPEAIITTNGSEPQNPLIPTNTTETGGGKIVTSLFAGLVSYTAEGDIELDVAESIESEDKQSWTVKLKEGQTFTDGTPVTANSFVDAWNFGAKYSNAQSASYFFDNIEGFSYTEDSELTGLTVEDDLTFTVDLVARRTSRCPSPRSRTWKPSVRTRSATVPTCSPAKTRGRMKRRSTS
jgi:oligopeptide transport system substrate-binding protein